MEAAPHQRPAGRKACGWHEGPRLAWKATQGRPVMGWQATEMNLACGCGCKGSSGLGRRGGGRKPPSLPRSVAWLAIQGRRTSEEEKKPPTGAQAMAPACHAITLPR